MLPKKFFENYFTGLEIKKGQLYVLMDFKNPDKELFYSHVRMAWLDAYQSICCDKDICPRVNNLDEIKKSLDLTDECWKELAESEFLFFDITGFKKEKKENAGEEVKKDGINPNVMFELGVALTIRPEERIMIIYYQGEGQEEKRADNLPFYLKHTNVDFYGKNGAIVVGESGVPTKDALQLYFQAKIKESIFYKDLLLKSVVRSLGLTERRVLLDINEQKKRNQKDFQWQPSETIKILQDDFFRMGGMFDSFAFNESVSRIFELGILQTKQFNNAASIRLTNFGALLLDFYIKKVENGEKI